MAHSITPEQLREMGRLVRVGLSVVELVEPDDPETWVITFNNPAASEASRTDVERFRGQRFLEAFPDIRGTPFIELYQQVFRTREAVELPEISYGDARVPEAVFRVWLMPLPGHGVLGQYVNVTAQRAAEAGLREANAHLEARVQERTEALRRARRDLQEVAHAAAHDLTTPVHHVQILSDLLSRSPGDAGLLSELREAALAARSQLNALLAHTAQAPEAPPAWVPTGQLFERARALAAHVAEAVSWNLEVSEVHTVREHFETIVCELLGNALCHHKPGESAYVVVSLRAHSGDAVLEVSDRGVGIAADQQERIFAPFYRLHDRPDHPGMGLALARRSAEACGATISLTSAPGAGSAFTVTFPNAVRATT